MFGNMILTVSLTVYTTRERERERPRDRETERQRDRETERQIDRETETQRDLIKQRMQKE